MKGAWTALRARTLSDQVYEAVLDRLVGGELAAGGFVREQELSAALGVSRTPIREALARLAADGFLERLPHRGYRVRSDSAAKLLELYPIISTLELLAGRLAFPRVTAADLKRLRSLNRALSSALEQGDADEAIALNDRFHAYVAQLAGNDRLSSLLEELRGPLRRLETWYYGDAERGAQSVREHDALIDALETGEVEHALAIFERNMALTTRALKES